MTGVWRSRRGARPPRVLGAVTLSLAAISPCSRPTRATSLSPELAPHPMVPCLSSLWATVFAQNLGLGAEKTGYVKKFNYVTIKLMKQKKKQINEINLHVYLTCVCTCARRGLGCTVHAYGGIFQLPFDTRSLIGLKLHHIGKLSILVGLATTRDPPPSTPQ